MKRVNAALLIAFFLMAGSTGYSRTIDPNYAVGTWQGFRTAAVTYTFDDHCSNQFAIAVPMFNEFGYKLTLYPVPNWGPNWTYLRNAANQGHEVGSHTMSHPDLSTKTIPEQTTELANSQTTINTNVTSQKCVTIAYPMCVPSNESLTAAYYIAGRTCSGAIVPATPSNFYQISSIALGSLGINTAAGITAKADLAAGSGGWCVYLIHGIDSDGGYSPLSSAILRTTLNYFYANPSKFWVSSFSNVVRYIKERNDVNVIEVSNTGETITVQVTDGLDNTIYNYPVTIRRILPFGWLAAKVTQNGSPVPYSITKVGAIKYLMFDVVPDGGDIVLSEDIYGNFTDPNIVGFEDFSVFGDLWLVSDCTATAAEDLNSDCRVNFYEYAFLAGNWQQSL